LLFDDPLDEPPEMDLEPSHAAPVSERPARMSTSVSMKMMVGPARMVSELEERLITSLGSVFSSQVMNTTAGPFRPSGIVQASMASDRELVAPPTMIWQNSCEDVEHLLFELDPEFVFLELMPLLLEDIPLDDDWELFDEAAELFALAAALELVLALLTL